MPVLQYVRNACQYVRSACQYGRHHVYCCLLDILHGILLLCRIKHASCSCAIVSFPVLLVQSCTSKYISLLCIMPCCLAGRVVQPELLCLAWSRCLHTGEVVPSLLSSIDTLATICMCGFLEFLEFFILTMACSVLLSIYAEWPATDRSSSSKYCVTVFCPIVSCLCTSVGLCCAGHSIPVLFSHIWQV